jgi:NDP-sugar pyrophosphorylase family protein
MSDERNEFYIRVIDELAGLRADHAVLRVIAENTLEQAKKTNGRMTKAEDRLDAHETVLAIAADRKNTSDSWKSKFGTAVIGLACAAIGFTALLVLQRTNIVDVANVTAEQYDSLPE